MLAAWPVFPDPLRTHTTAASSPSWTRVFSNALSTVKTFFTARRIGLSLGVRE